MNVQVYIVPKQLTEADLTNPKASLLVDSGMLGGLVVNCLTDDDVMNAIKAAVKFGHGTDVKYLADGEEWPTAAQRRAEYFGE